MEVAAEGGVQKAALQVPVDCRVFSGNGKVCGTGRQSAVVSQKYWLVFVLLLESSSMVPADKLTYGLSEYNLLLKRMIF